MGGVALLAVAVAVAAQGGCGGGGTPVAPFGEAVYLLRVCEGSPHAPDGERFRVALRNPAEIARAEALRGRGPIGGVGGRLARGDGGFNAPWSWHLTPETTEFFEVSIEVCQGCPSFVEADLAYWVDTLGRYCPVGVEVVARER